MHRNLTNLNPIFSRWTKNKKGMFIFLYYRYKYTIKYDVILHDVARDKLFIYICYGQTSELPWQNANCPQSSGKMSYFGLFPDKPSCLIRNCKYQYVSCMVYHKTTCSTLLNIFSHDVLLTYTVFYFTTGSAQSNNVSVTATTTE